jgi:hypothetical protein
MQKKEGILKDSDQRGPNAEDPVELKVYLALKNKPPNLKFVCHYETGGTPLELGPHPEDPFKPKA